LGLLSPPVPLSQWYLQSNEIIKSQYEMLKLSINAQGSRVITVVVQVGAVEINICNSSGDAQEK
jgi:hypothetical protein